MMREIGAALYQLLATTAAVGRLSAIVEQRQHPNTAHSQQLGMQLEAGAAPQVVIVAVAGVAAVSETVVVGA